MTGNNLVNAFYSDYLAEITDKESKMLTCTMIFSPLDIYSLDWSRLKVIDGVAYRLNKIADYDPEEGGVARVELLKVINLQY